VAQSSCDVQVQYDVNLKALLLSGDYEGAAALKRVNKAAVDLLEYSAQLALLLKNDDYEGAAALKKANEARCIDSKLVASHALSESAYGIQQGDIEKRYELELGLLLARADYNGAASLKSEKDQGRFGIAVPSLVTSKSPTHELSSRLHHVEPFSEAALVDAEDAKMRDMLLAEDYVGAAALKRERSSLYIQQNYGAASSDGLNECHFAECD